jgi:hypothetical protein
VNSFKVREKAKEHLQIKMARFIEVILQMIWSRAKVSKVL